MSEFATQSTAPRLLGLAASLRNSRSSADNESFCRELASQPDEATLLEFLKAHSEPHPDRGRLSNSEIGLATGLWAAAHAGSEIAWLRLSDFFTTGSGHRNLSELRDAIRATDGILLSTPVYFGDRSSLAGDFLNFLNRESDLKQDIIGKVAGGIAVGAKRNGGQETTLIYQLSDLLETGFLGVGNDSDTTAQYGGTGHAGDIGSLLKDQYGLWTAQGVGRRLAHVAGLLKLGLQTQLQGKLRLLFLVLQDHENQAIDLVHDLCKANSSSVDVTILNLTENRLKRCLACGTCPTRVDLDSAYTCKVAGERYDDMASLHAEYLDQDAIIPVVYSAVDTSLVRSRYHTFMERSRYLRRGDYLFSDRLVAPLVIEELGSRHHLDLRLLTSWIRHHTVVTRPLMLHRQGDTWLNLEELKSQFSRMLRRAETLTAGRLQIFRNGGSPGVTRYNPVGYVLPNTGEDERKLMQARDAKVCERNERAMRDAQERLATSEVVDA